MSRLHQFLSLLEGQFDNRRQLAELGDAADALPLARHVNTACNHKLAGLPADFSGVFLVEESYYTVQGNSHASPHLFLFTQEGEQIKLTSYAIPAGYDKAAFTYAQMGTVDYAELQPSEKFTPALYTLRDGIWEGGSVSMFSPAVKFTLYERFCADWLEVSETMEVNGRRTFGYDRPIVYRRSAE